MSADNAPPRPVDPAQYSEGYFLEEVGGAELYRLYGPRVVTPLQAYALQRARLEPGMQALDVGCGRGEILYQLERREVSAAGIDISAAALELARRNTRAPVMLADAKNLPFPDRSLDRIFFLGVLDHLHDWELERCFAEFARVLKPGGFVLANTCTNIEYYKRLSFRARARLAAILGLKEPTAMRSSKDEQVHVNEHSQRALEEFFKRIGWQGAVEPRANDKLYLRELYGQDLPPDFPMRPAPPWKRAWVGLSFRGPWRRFLARSFFCVASPG